MSIAVGKANYNSGGSFERPPFFKLGHKQDKDRVLVVRIAPPVGDLAERGIWSRFLKQHFGYTIQIPGKSGGPTRNIPVTFNCIEDRDPRDRTVVKQRCPECDEIARQKKLLEDKTKKMQGEGKTEEEIDTSTRFLKSWLKDHNLDKKWHMVAKDVSSRWGFLTVSHSCYKLLKGNSENPGVIDRLVAKGLDPLDRGVWLKLTRSGVAWNDIKDIPEPLMEEQADAPGSFRMKFDTLTEADLDQIAKLPSLDALGRPLTFEQIETLVKHGGDEEVVRDVMNIPRPVRGQGGQASTPAPAAASKPASPSVPVDEYEDEPAPEPIKAAPAPAPSKAAAKPPELVEDDEETAALKALEAIKAKKAMAAAAAKVKAAEEQKAAQPKANTKIKEDLDLPMEEFLKKYENNAK